MNDPSTEEEQLKEYIARDLRPGISDQNSDIDGELIIDEVRFEGTAPDTTLVVLLVHSERPECRFGLRVRLWNSAGRLRGGWDGSSPEATGAQILMEFYEILATEEGFAQDCVPGEITWVEGTYWSERRWDLGEAILELQREMACLMAQTELGQHDRGEELPQMISDLREMAEKVRRLNRVDRSDKA